MGESKRRVRPVVVFREDEISSFKNKKTGAVHHHAHVGGRLRLAHEHEECLSIETTIFQFEARALAVVQAKVTLSFGVFGGVGTADSQRDRDKIDALLELAETRAIARALRWAGYGVENAGAEEMERMEDAVAAAADPSRAPATADQCKDLIVAFSLKNIPAATWQAGIQKDYGVGTLQALTQTQAAELISKVKTKK